MADESNENQGATNAAGTPSKNGKTSATSVALTATFNFTESRKYNFDVSGSASIEATLKSVPPPQGLIEFIRETTTNNS